MLQWMHFRIVWTENIYSGCVCRCVFVYTCVYMCAEDKGWLLGVFLNLSYFLSQGFSSLVWARSARLAGLSQGFSWYLVWVCSARLAGWPVSPGIQPVPASPALGSQLTSLVLGTKLKSSSTKQHVLYQFRPSPQPPRHPFSLSNSSNAFWSSVKERLNLIFKVPDFESYVTWSWIKNKNLGLFKSICFGNK